MPSSQVDALLKMILGAMPGSASLDAAVDTVKDQLNILAPDLAEHRADDLAAARELAARQFEKIEVLHRHSVIRKRMKWYFGPNPGDFHWPALKAYLTGVKEWAEVDVASIDDASNEVVSLLENPSQESQFSGRGLVVGHVQSGKTANMTAVIAKALDAGYNTVLVLAGLTNKLRHQTQLRLFHDLVCRNPMQWHLLTANEIHEDFRAPPAGGFLSHTDKAQVAIVKKNVSPLSQLKKAIAETIPLALSRLRVLVIDDECDQASVNSASGELEMTAINHRIRELLSLLPSVSYVGYTATPFANVLINPYAKEEGEELDDLYPRDFITALPRPATYFGAEQLFGREPSVADDVQPDEEGLDMIRGIPEEDAHLLQPVGRSDVGGFQPAMVQSLEDAILYFLACCAARRARGHADKHMTMLVHTSVYVVMHDRLAALVRGWKDKHARSLLDRSSEITQRLKDIWSSERNRVPSHITDANAVDFRQVRKYLPEVLNNVEVAVENGSSDDRIDYGAEPRTYIVVGGNILARGLTLEGLMVSYFLRSSRQFDTLLQMGRWFGYRAGYEDLPRIWTTEELKLKFRALAGVENEIRLDIDQYAQQDLTPMDAAVRIRTIPGMAITGATKMRHARQCAVSFWGEHRQTFRFNHRDSNWLLRNWEAGAELVSRAEELGYRDDESTDRKLWLGVPKSSIVRFFETYQTHETHADLAQNFLVSFLDSQDERLGYWNVAIVEPRRTHRATRTLGTVGDVRLVRRARLKDTGNVADIKALMSRADIGLDCPDLATTRGSWRELKAARQEEVGDVPLLLLYAIDKASAPQTKSNVRATLDAVDDILGYGVVFPGSVTEGGDFVSVEIQPLSADELDDKDAEEEAQARAAGVE